MRTIRLDMPCTPHEPVDEATLTRVQRSFPEADTLMRLSEIFSALGDPTRLRLLLALCQQPLCVHDLAQILGVSESAVSHQLRMLRMLRLVTAQRAGKRVYYSLDDEHVYRLIQEGLKHACER
ncbi:MAG: metalloregulator ArsR/SmtB family transcription factor [Armatimonadota bacterium]|nr:metalloregulator ArsR/SmtB family transcription factor [Armatimonadota bacterium]MDW8291183.1 metalloregulator ArsR/SmtB family transcription factor [Armatimonadota bacterium]